MYKLSDGYYRHSRSSTTAREAAARLINVRAGNL
jgi:hypothetical protein